MSAIFALAAKDLRLLGRDRAGFFFTFIFPVGFALFFGMIFAGDNKGGMAGSGIDVAVLDSDNTEASRAFAKTLKDAEELAVTVPASLDEGNRLVVESKVVALIQIMPGYGEGQQNLFWRGGKTSTIEVAVDPSKKAEAGMLQGVLQKYAFAGMGKSFTDPKASKVQIDNVRKKIADSKDMSATDRLMFNTFFNSMDTFMGQLDQRDLKAKDAEPDSKEKKDEAGFAFEPVKIVNRDLSRRHDEFPPNSWTISFPQGIIWGVMGAALGFAASLVGEKTGGTFGRLMAAPLPRWGVLGGKALACFITMSIVTVVMIAVAMILCGVRVANWPVLVLAIVCTGLCFVGLMTLIASLAKTERAAAGYGWGTLMPLAMLGGAAVPSFAMPAFIRSLGHVSPMYWCMRLLEGGLWRDLSLPGAMNSVVYVPAAVTLGIALVGFGLGVVSLRRT